MREPADDQGPLRDHHHVFVLAEVLLWIIKHVKVNIDCKRKHECQDVHPLHPPVKPQRQRLLHFNQFLNSARLVKLKRLHVTEVRLLGQKRRKNELVVLDVLRFDCEAKA